MPKKLKNKISGAERVYSDEQLAILEQRNMLDRFEVVEELAETKQVEKPSSLKSFSPSKDENK